MRGLGRSLRARWEKLSPEVLCGLSGGLPGFIGSPDPADSLSGIPVFVYHDVHPDWFRGHLDFLDRNGYRTIGADPMLSVLRREVPLPTRTVMLTFDDGARNLYEVVFPELRARGHVGVAFIAPGLHADGEPDTGPGGERKGRACTWSELREMHRSGHLEFQSHTFDHRYVPRWPETAPLVGVADEWVERHRGPERPLGEDLDLARRLLEERLGGRVRHLAFPRYHGTLEAVAVAREAGYEGLWWGALPGRPLNRPGDPTTHIVRVNGAYLPRLPGEGRRPLTRVLKERYVSALTRPSFPTS